MKANLDNIVDILIKRTNFESFLNGNVDFWFWYCENSSRAPKYIKFAYGATRAIFWDDRDPSIVFKFNKSHTDSYCEIEKMNWDIARDTNCAHWFAPIKFEKKIGIVNFYSMPFCDIDEERLSSESFKYHLNKYCADENINFDEINNIDERERIYDEVDESYCSDQEGMLEYLYSIYDYNDVRHLEEFLDKHCINDCHCGNFGYLNGRLVLIDYCGYGTHILKQFGLNNENDNDESEIY